MYDIGELDQLIDIKRKTLASDGMGGQTVTITNVAQNVWCKPRALSGKEVLKYDQMTASSMTAFVMRYRTDVLPADYLVWNSENYNIRYIAPASERDLYIVIEAERGVAD